MSEKIVLNNVKGLWFYGLAGSGKSFASVFVSSLIVHPFVIDGDVVRKYISCDLTYSSGDRKKQTARIFGIGKIAIENQFFPIMSSVSMNCELLAKCKSERIKVIQIKRSLEQLKKVRDLYQGKKNVVGMDLPLEDLDTFALVNDGTHNFKTMLSEYVKSRLS